VGSGTVVVVTPTVVVVVGATVVVVVGATVVVVVGATVVEVVPPLPPEGSSSSQPVVATAIVVATAKTAR